MARTGQNKAALILRRIKSLLITAHDIPIEDVPIRTSIVEKNPCMLLQFFVIYIF